MARPRIAVIFDFDETLAVDTGHPRSDPVLLFGGRQRLTELTVLLKDLKESGIMLAVCSFNSRAIIEPLLQRARLLPFFTPDLILGSEVFQSDAGLLGWDKGRVVKSIIEPKLMMTMQAAGKPAEAVNGAGMAVPVSAEAVTGASVAVPGPSVQLPRRPDSAGAITASTDGQSVILFCDDDRANIHSVRQACAGCATCHVARTQGLETAHFAAIRKWAGLAPGSAAAATAVASSLPEMPPPPSPQPPPLGGKQLVQLQRRSSMRRLECDWT